MPDKTGNVAALKIVPAKKSPAREQNRRLQGRACRDAPTTAMQC